MPAVGATSGKSVIHRVGPDGLCPDCHKPLPGIWGQSSGHGDGRIRPIA